MHTWNLECNRTIWRYMMPNITHMQWPHYEPPKWATYVDYVRLGRLRGGPNQRKRPMSVTKVTIHIRKLAHPMWGVPKKAHPIYVNTWTIDYKHASIRTRSTSYYAVELRPNACAITTQHAKTQMHYIFGTKQSNVIYYVGLQQSNVILQGNIRWNVACKRNILT